MIQKENHFCTKAVRNADFQVNFGFGVWWLHFFRLRCLLSHSSMNLSSSWTFRAGSRTPSKMYQFPRTSLSELWKVKGFLASPFCVGFLSPTVQTWSFWAGCSMPALVAISFKNKPGIICSGQNLILEAKICHWKVLEQGNLNETAQKEYVGHILSEALKWCQIPGNGQNHNF